MNSLETGFSPLLYGRDIICTQDLTMHEILAIIKTAVEMKKSRYDEKWTNLLKNKTFLMLFYSPSFRTHLSFVSALNDLGGHAQYFEPRMGRFQTHSSAGESLEDLAKVSAGYAAAIGIRLMEGDVNYYGAGHKLIRDFADFSNVPVINMADDVCHPCQGLADIMGWAEAFSENESKINLESLRNKKLLVTWGKGSLARSWNSPQESLLLASRFGMNITIARPEGYDFDTKILELTKNECLRNGQEFNIVADPHSGYVDADVVYSRHWVSEEAYSDGKFNKQSEIDKALSPQYSDWITTQEKMLKTSNALFTHPMPIDRNYEVEDNVASGNRSVVYNIAHNRLHIEKAILAHTLFENMG